jgi:Trk K+ transport system NAD-binding subunit
VALTRGGRAQLPDPDLVLQAGDLLHMAVHTADMPRVNALLAQGEA